MREIKFKGMDLQGRWHYGLPCHIQTKKANTPEGWYISNSVGIPTAYQVRPETVSQLTGLLDKNEKEIYEGDNLKGVYTGDYSEEKPVKGVVRFEYGRFVLVWNTGRLWLNDIYNREVIGNIYENPELTVENQNKTTS